MDFALSGEQQQFAATLHDLLAAADVPAAARSWAAGDRMPGLEIWRSLADCGVTGLMVPPDHGGLGADPADLVIACEELGHHAVPGPVAESIAAVPVLLGAGCVGHFSCANDDSSCGTATSVSGISQFAVTDRMKSRPPGRAGPEIWLRQLGQGELIATLAAPPWLPLAADADTAGLVLFAECSAMIAEYLSGHSQQTLRDHESAMVLRLGAAGQTHRSVDPARTLAEVSAGQAVAEGPEVAAALARALDFGALACAAQLLGAGRALLEATAQYARQRVQFGQPVGAFQAVKHHLADVLIGLEFARPLLFGAAIAMAADCVGPARPSSAAAQPGAARSAAARPGPAAAQPGAARSAAARDVSAAKVACADAATRAARIALQVHGAIGYTAEHDISLYLTKVRALAPAWGSQAQHRARLLAALTGEGS